MSEKSKKWVIIGVVVVVLVILVSIIACNISIENLNDNKVGEIVPEEEISDKQLRETTVSLFFYDETKNIVNEIKKVDSKLLLDDPYNITIRYLLEGPSNSSFKTAIPVNTKVNNIEKKGDCVFIDFSREFVDEMEDNENLCSIAIKQIVKTLTQYSEINNVKISVEGKNDVSFKDGNINLNQIFTANYEE